MTSEAYDDTAVLARILHKAPRAKLETKMMTKMLIPALLATALAAPASAAVIFDLSPTNNVTGRGAGSGPAQGVSVTTTTNISSFSMFLQAPFTGGTNVKFTLWNGALNTLLQSSVVALPQSGSLAWVNSGSFNYTLTAGSTYYFGVVGDSNLNVGFIFPQGPYSSNGLTALTNGNANISGFGSPTITCCAGAQIGLRIESGGAVVPEPQSWAMLIAGFGLVGAVMRRRAALAA